MFPFYLSNRQRRIIRQHRIDAHQYRIRPRRRPMANSRDSALVIHFDSPEAVAIFPSSVIPALTVTNGVRMDNPVVKCFV